MGLTAGAIAASVAHIRNPATVVARQSSNGNYQARGIARTVRCWGGRSLLALLPVLGGCVGPTIVGFPYDPGGRSLNSPFLETEPHYSGRYLVFASDRRGSQDIFLYDTQNRVLVEMPGLNAIDMVASSPAISANGRYVVFIGSRDGRNSVYLYDRETRQLRNLTQNLKADVRHPTINGDGTVIAFESSATGQWDIVLYNRNGQPIEALRN